MSDADLSRDLRLTDRLGQLPQPALPAGLAARIVANATRLPQDYDEPAEEPAPAALPQRRNRWWLPHAVGTAIAASVAAALFLQQGSVDPTPQAAATRIVRQAPAPLPQVQPESLAAAPSHELERIASATPAAAPKPKTVKQSGKPSPGPSPEPAPAPSAAPSSQEQTPELAVEQKPPAGEGPTMQAYGPPSTDDRGAPMLQSEPSSGLGISGTSGPSAPAPAPSRPGRGASTMPRF